MRRPGRASVQTCRPNNEALPAVVRKGLGSRQTLMEDPGMESPSLRRRRSQHERIALRLEEALAYFKRITSRVPAKGNVALQQHLTTIEAVGLSEGVPAEAIDVLLKLALSGNLVDKVNTHILKSLVPAADIFESTLISALSLFCTGKSSTQTQILFLRWLISVFDLVSLKEVFSPLYNFFFCLLQDDTLCPSLCHLLYLLTDKGQVRAYRVRVLLDLQSRKGMQAHILGLLSLYKVYCPELVSVSLPSRYKRFFQKSTFLFANEWKTVLRKKTGDPDCDRKLTQSHKRKWNRGFDVPVCSVGVHKDSPKDLEASLFLPLEKVKTFAELLENILNCNLPAQMGCVLNRPLLLNYINCLKEDDALLRLNYWLAFTLHEECAWYTGKKQSKEDVASFLDTVVTAQEFLQEGLSGSEEFLHKCLPHWNGCHRSQILCLISQIPLHAFSEIESLLYETLTQLFIPSSLWFKLDVLKSLRELLQNWMIRHSVYVENVENENDTMTGMMSSVENMIQFTGRLCTVGLQMHNSSLLLHSVLDFYTLVSDLYVRFSLPLIVLPPGGVFYPALVCKDCVNLNQLCYIMCRYRDNLLKARKDEKENTARVLLNINSQTFKLYNQYLTAMVGCLWTSQAFSLDSHPQGIKMTPEVLERAGVSSYKRAFNIVFHPALMAFSFSFLQQNLSEDDIFSLRHLKGHRWDNYTEFLSSQGMTDLTLFLEASVNRVASKKKDTTDESGS
ncbi:PREDICTED: centromere protein I [Nanorana parkeri]|uniref:centromere protein I n=1 Tax=Nanorana parkeri TaxID=125878 RepID=UPI0008543C64|nr:PREDICTED: centromere protein I [Nanorana parkeri]